MVQHLGALATLAKDQSSFPSTGKKLVTPVPGEPIPSFDLLRYYIYEVYIPK